MRPSFSSPSKSQHQGEAQVPEIAQVIVDILRREGANETMMLGARLGALLHEENGDLLREEMNRRGVRLTKLLEEIQDVRVVRHFGTGLDVLVGLEGAVPPSPTRGESPFLRADVYAAFTRAGTQYSYDAGRDEFHEGPPLANGVECSPVSFADLTEMRSAFAETLPEPHCSEIRGTLDGKSGSLSRFRATVLQLGLTARWEQFRYVALSSNVREWANSQDIEVRADWFRRAASTRQHGRGPKELLVDLARTMTDEEAKAVLISVGSVDRYLERRRHGPSV